MRRVASGALAVVLGLVALAAMRWSAPGYDRITGPIDFAGKSGKLVRTDNLAVVAGRPHLARSVTFEAFGFASMTRDTGGVWLVVPVLSLAQRTTVKILGASWEARDGRRFTASKRVADADAILPGKFVQPGLERRDLVVFELPRDAVRDGALLLSEDAYPQLAGEARVAFPDRPLPAPHAALDLDRLDARL